MYLLVAFVLVPIQLGYLYSLGKKRSGRFTLEGIVLFRERMPWWQYAVLGLTIVTWIVLIFLGIGEQSADFFRAQEERLILLIHHQVIHQLHVILKYQ